MPQRFLVPQEKLRARHLSNGQMTRLEELWKLNPAAKVDDLDQQPGLDEEANPVALRYEVRLPGAEDHIELGIPVPARESRPLLPTCAIVPKEAILEL